MPLISTLGAASSRGFGEFSQSAQANYIENFFNTYLYDGNGGSQIINTGIPLSNTSSWSSYKLQQNNSVGNGIAADTSGNIYIIGYANDGTNDYIIIAKYNSSGTIQWQRSLKQNNSYGYGITTDSSGNIYVTGFPNDGTNSYIIIAKYDTSGTIQWQRKLKQNNSLGYGITTDSSGNVYVTGSANDGATNYIIIAKYNSSGAIQWQRKLKQNASTGRGIVTDSSGNVYITGSANDGSTNYIIIAKYDSSGVIQWQRNLQQNNSSGFGIAADTSGNIYVTGRANDGLNNYTIIAKYNSSGAIQWQRKLKQNISVGYGVTTDSSGNVYVAAYDSDGSINYILVAKYNSSGTIQWQRKLAQNNSFGYGVTTDTSGNVYITGYATDSAQYIVTTKLAQDGSTTSGTAFVDMVLGASTESAGGATDSAASATDSAGGATDSAGGATDSAGGATSSSATQAATTSQGGLVWIKGRSGATDHALYDTNRGATFDLVSNSTAAQTTQTTGLNAFSASGFAIGSLAKLNTSSAIYAAWTFRKQPKFFDVVTWTGTGTTGRSIPHNLGSAPGMMIFKKTNSIDSWFVYHRGATSPNASWWQNYLVLNSPGASTSDTPSLQQPTSTNIVLDDAYYNGNGVTYVAYLFAHDAGGFGTLGTDSVINCGSYVGNGSTTGPTVTLGWEPQLILIKSTASGPNWNLFDNMRGIPTGAADPYLFANTAGAEAVANGDLIDLTPTGFTIKSTNAQVNTNTGTYIYMAIRRGPMKVPTDATTVFQPTVYTGTNVANRLVNTTIAPDMIWARQRNSTTFGGMLVGDRLRGQPYLATGTNAAEVTSATALDQQIVSATEYGTAFSSMSGVWVGNDATAQLNASTTASNQIMEGFKRAPGFFDIVCFTTTASNNQRVSHNLTVVPELMIQKDRALQNWVVYTASEGLNKFIRLNLSNASTAFTGIWGTAPTSTDFGMDSLSLYGAAGKNIVSYLFASCPGVSKVGSYTGTGTTQQVNCGFTSGARFVLIKRTDSTGDWYVYDSARGIVAGNDPYILLNSTAAEVTSTDYVDPYSAGFELSSTAPAALNEAPGITWITQTSGFGTSWIFDVTYANGIYVAVGESGKLFTSTDGITWTSRTSSFGATTIYGVTYGNGLFVAVGSAGTMATSPDGITWTSRTSGFGTTDINKVTYGNGLFVAVGGSGKITTSTDGITWTSRTSGFGTTTIMNVTYGNGLFVAVGFSGTLTTSSDGITWTSRTSGFGATAIYAVTYANGLYVAGGAVDGGTGNAAMSTSSDGITWTFRNSGISGNVINGLGYGNGVFVAVGSSGAMSTSTNGTTWTARTSGTSSNLYAVAYNNSLFVVVGSAGTVITNSPTYIYLAIA